MSDFLEAAFTRQTVPYIHAPTVAPIDIPTPRHRAYPQKSSRGYAVLLTLMVGLTVAPTWVVMRAGVEGLDPYASAVAQPVLEPLALPVALPHSAFEPMQQVELDPYQPDPAVPVAPPLQIQSVPTPPLPFPPQPVREPVLERGAALDGNLQRPVKKKHKKRVKAKKHKHSKHKHSKHKHAKHKHSKKRAVLPPKCPRH